MLFSRDYLPLWRLRDGKPPERVEPWLWIKFVKQEWFFQGRRGAVGEPGG